MLVAQSPGLKSHSFRKISPKIKCGLSTSQPHIENDRDHLTSRIRDETELKPISITFLPPYSSTLLKVISTLCFSMLCWESPKGLILHTTYTIKSKQLCGVWPNNTHPSMFEASIEFGQCCSSCIPTQA